MSYELPLLLVPGLLCTQDLWADQIAVFGKEREIIVAKTFRQTSMSAIAESVLAKAPPRFALAGLSMGGYLSFEIMRQAPLRVDRLCLVDTSSRADTPEALARRRGLVELAGKGKFKGITPKLLPTLIHRSRLDDKILCGRVMAMADTIGPEGFINQTTATMNRVDSRPILPKIRCPVMVIVGEEDELTPVEVAKEMAEGVANGQLRIIKECGHLAPLERPSETTAAMREWLSSPSQIA